MVSLSNLSKPARSGSSSWPVRHVFSVALRWVGRGIFIFTVGSRSLCCSDVCPPIQTGYPGTNKSSWIALIKTIAILVIFS
ncbi:hypothetical protein OG21DRAFT_779253 [Imleria badia]|nr:hypothetical protein OG21DRAFT_779253 [Imleria badia]